MSRRHHDAEVVERGPIEVGRRSVTVGLGWQITWWLTRKAGKILVRIATHAHWYVVLVGLVAYVQLGMVGALIWMVALSALITVWLWRSPDTFRRRVTQRMRGYFRRLTTYGRRRWEGVMISPQVILSQKRPDGHLLPRIRYIRSSPAMDVLRVRMLPGQVLTDWAEVAHRLAVGFDCEEDSCRVGTVAPWRPTFWPSWLWFPSLTRKSDINLSFLHRDPLTTTHAIAPHPASETPDFKALPVALCEDGRWYRLRLLGQHLFIAGATGAGKGSVLWSLIHQLAPALPLGLVRLVGLDPKGGVELGVGRALFGDFCRGESSEISVEAQFADLLERYVTIMRDRQATMFSRFRLHRPTPEDPFIVIVIDELASLVAAAYQSDRDAGKRFVSALNVLLSQGRAMGITVVGAVQDPRKESVPMRGLFTTRIALRLNEATDVALVLGEGARERGAWCDKVKIEAPGTGYVVPETSPEPVRIRFPYLDDDAIRDMARTYGGPGNLHLLPSATTPPAPAEQPIAA